MNHISVCIPVYNHDVRPLAQALLAQKAKASYYDIIFLDDGSDADFRKVNEWLKNEPRIKYNELGKNVGRAAIRNRLAASAMGEAILFLDDDSLIEHLDFISKYLDISEGKTVICGGRKYPENLPHKDYSLHWNYGKTQESKTAEERNQQPYEAFHSNNFLIPKKVWEEVPFDENLTQYGHEDTLLGYELSRQNFPVIHIDNEVIHGQLQNNPEFLDKTRVALENLNTLYHRGNGDFNNSVRILRTYDRLERFPVITKLLATLWQKKSEQWERKLSKSGKPSLWLFNLYKLCYLIYLMRKG